MSGYDRHIAEHLRLTLLRLLANQGGGYQANESVLADAAAQFGFTPTRDRLRTELTWLAEQGLVTLEEAADLYVAKVTGRGLEVAEGRASVPGVKRPRPG